MRFVQQSATPAAVRRQSRAGRAAGLYRGALAAAGLLLVGCSSSDGDSDPRGGPRGGPEDQNARRSEPDEPTNPAAPQQPAASGPELPFPVGGVPFFPPLEEIGDDLEQCFARGGSLEECAGT